MRKILLITLLLVAASTHATLRNSCVRYQKDHFFYHRGEEMNVIDIDLEWPEYVDGFQVKNLQAYLAATLFGAKGEFEGFEKKAMKPFCNALGFPSCSSLRPSPTTGSSAMWS